MTPLPSLPIKPPRVSVARHADGTIVLTQDYPPAPAHRSIAHLFHARAATYPERVFIAKRALLADGAWGDWRRLRYGAALTEARSAAQAMLDRGLGQDASVMVLSGPSPEHAVLTLAGMFAQAPVTAVATAYALLARDFEKLQHTVRLCRPKMIFVEGPEYARALDALPLEGIEIVSLVPIPGRKTTLYSALIATQASADVDRALEAITPATVARYVFTSGSTGAPKAVIHTQGTLTAQIASRNALLADPMQENDSVRLSWMPWNHIGGVIHVLYAIEDGGAYYIDEGRPIPGQFGETLRNLHDVIPAEFNAVPVAYGYLVDALEKDADLCRRFFASVRYMSYGSAALSDDIFKRLQALAIRFTGAPVAFCTKYGTTEVQAVTHSGHPMDRPGEIGIPYPGATIKLVPTGDKLEIRAKGDMITPGYIGGPDVNAGVFDEEGFYKTGDAAAFVDPADPARGLLFDGRVAENFKLSSGTWVSVGALRIALIEALAPLVQDLVVAGHDRDFVAVMAWPKAHAAAEIAGVPAGAPLETSLASDGVRRFVEDRLSAHNARVSGSSLKVARLVFLTEPPQGDEQAEKGYINQRRTLSRRAATVEALFADPPSAAVIVAARSKGLR